MGTYTLITKAGEHYEAAQAAHYEAKNLPEALKLYKGVMATHPDSEEAKYSRVQIQNIVHSVVSKQKLFDAQVEMAMDLLEDGEQPD